jgi:hypothetical protein
VCGGGGGGSAIIISSKKRRRSRRRSNSSIQICLIKSPAVNIANRSKKVVVQYGTIRVGVVVATCSYSTSSDSSSTKYYYLCSTK